MMKNIPENNQNNVSDLHSASQGVATRPSPETLRQETEAAAWLQAHSANLEALPSFLPASKHRLLTRIEREARRSAWEHIWALPQFRLAANGTTLALLIISLVLFNGILFGAARLTLPGDVLYPVKLGGEQIRLALTFSEGQKAGLYVSLARERSNELQALMIEGEYGYVEVTSMRMLDLVDQANLHLAQARDLSQERQFTLVGDLSQVLSLQQLVLQAVVTSAPPESQPVVEHILLSVR